MGQRFPKVAWLHIPELSAAKTEPALRQLYTGTVFPRNTFNLHATYFTVDISPSIGYTNGDLSSYSYRAELQAEGAIHMNLDDLKKTIQDFFQENTVTIVGSGLSLAEGIPGMSDLAKELLLKVTDELTDQTDVEIWNCISSELNNGVGLEEALHNNRPSPQIEDCIRAVTAQYIGDAERNILHDVMFNRKTLRFSEYIKHFNIRNSGLVVITTNYDRLIEYACEAIGVRIDTLFIGHYFAQFQPEQSKYMFCKNIARRPGKTCVEYAPKVTVLKPHGCLSWHMIDGQPYSIPQSPSSDSLIITPGINKYREGYNVPFDTHRTKANAAIDSAQRYIILGYGFGDDHLETHLVQQLKNGKPALILTRSLSSKAQAMVNSCRNIVSICRQDDNDSIVITSAERTIFHNCNLWDLHTMLREVF